jgi:hypothetical protein
LLVRANGERRPAAPGAGATAIPAAVAAAAAAAGPTNRGRTAAAETAVAPIVSCIVDTTFGTVDEGRTARCSACPVL